MVQILVFESDSLHAVSQSRKYICYALKFLTFVWICFIIDTISEAMRKRDGSLVILREENSEAERFSVLRSRYSLYSFCFET